MLNKMKWTVVILFGIFCIGCDGQSEADPYFDINYDDVYPPFLDDDGYYDEKYYDDAAYAMGDGKDDNGGYLYEDSFLTDDFMMALNETENRVTPRRVIVPSVYGIIALVGIVLNPLAVVIAQKTKNLKYSQRIFLQNLCVASFLVSINIPIPAVYRATMLWYFGTIGCKIHNCLSNYTLLAQAYFAIALCYDFVILKIRPNIKEKKRTVLEIITLEFGWLISLAFSSPMLIFSEERYGQCGVFFDDDEVVDDDNLDMEFDADLFNVTAVVDRSAMCNILPTETNFKIWIICSFVFSFVLPVVALIVAYVIYCCHAKKSQNSDNSMPRCEEIVTDEVHDVITTEENKLLEKNLECNENNNNNNVDEGREKIIAENPTFMVTGTWVSFIGIAYFVCWLPLHVYHLGRIPGYYISWSACHNVRDYAFIQGYLSALLFPFMTICYCRPTVLKVWRARANINFTKTHHHRSPSSTQMVNLQTTSSIQNV